MGPMDGMMGMMGKGGGPDQHAVEGEALRSLLTKIRELMVELADAGVPGAEQTAEAPMKGKVTAVEATMPAEGTPEEEGGESPEMAASETDAGLEGPSGDLTSKMKDFFMERSSPLDKKTFQAGSPNPKEEMFKKRR